MSIVDNTEPQAAATIQIQTETTCNVNEFGFEIEETDAVCVDYIDLGKQETEFGIKDQCKFVFETEHVNERGYPVTITRLFNKSFHEKSSLRPFLEQWRGELLKPVEVQKGIKLDKMVGRCAKIKYQDSVSKKGFAYLKLVEIGPLDGQKIKASGKYKRWEPTEAKN